MMVIDWLGLLLGGLIGFGTELISEPAESSIGEIWEKGKQYRKANEALNKLKGDYGEEFLQGLSNDIRELEGIKSQHKEKKAYAKFILDSMNCINKETIEKFSSLKDADPLKKQRAIEALLEFKNLLLSSLLKGLGQKEKAIVQITAQRAAIETGETVKKILKEGLNEAFWGPVKEKITECPHCRARGYDLVYAGAEMYCKSCGYRGDSEKLTDFGGTFKNNLNEGITSVKTELASVKVEIIDTIQKAQGETNKQFTKARESLKRAQQQAENHFQEMGERLAELKEYGATNSESLEKLKQVMEEQKNSLEQNFQQLSDELQNGFSKLTNDMRAEREKGQAHSDEERDKQTEDLKKHFDKNTAKQIKDIEKILSGNQSHKAEGEEKTCPCCGRVVVLEPKSNNMERHCPDCDYKVDPGLEPRANSCTDILDVILTYKNQDGRNWLSPRTDKTLSQSPKAVRLVINSETVRQLNNYTPLKVSEKVAIGKFFSFVLVGESGSDVELPVTTLQRLIGRFASKPAKICIGNGITLTGDVTSALENYKYTKNKYCFVWEVSK